MYSQELVDSLADRAYAAMVDFDRWPSFLVYLSNALGGCSPLLYRHDPQSKVGTFDLTVDHDPALKRAFNEHLYRCNVWLNSRPQYVVPGRARTSHMMCSRRVLLASQWWSDWCRPMGITQAIGATILKVGPITYNLSVCADDSRPAFGDADLRLLTALMPHLQRSMRMSMLLGDVRLRESSIALALDRLPTAVFLVTGRGRVLFLNQAAERLLLDRRGLSLGKDGLTTTLPADSTALRALIGRAAETSANRVGDSGGTLAVRRPGGMRPLELQVSPIHLEDQHPLLEAPAALVYASDPETVPSSVAVELQRRFELTPAEARVAIAIGRGKTARQIADTWHLSIHTVRTQLKAVLAKTGASRQVDLVRLINHLDSTAN